MRKTVRSVLIAAAIAALVGWMYSLGDGIGRSGAWPIAAAVFLSLWALFATGDPPRTSWPHRLAQSAYWVLVPAALLAQRVGLVAHSEAGRHNGSILLFWMAVLCSFILLVQRERLERTSPLVAVHSNLPLRYLHRFLRPPPSQK